MQAADQPKILKVATDRLDWINKNVPTIETWLRNHFELPEVSTIIAETTTSSSSAVFIPIFMVLSSILANFYMN